MTEGTHIVLEETPFDTLDDETKDKLQDRILTVLEAQDVEHSKWLKFGPEEA